VLSENSCVCVRVRACVCWGGAIIVHNIDLFTHSLHGAVLLEKLIGSQLVKKFPAFYGTRRPITAFAIARHLPLSWASSIQSMPIILTVSVNKPYTNPHLGYYFSHSSSESSEYPLLVFIVFAFLVAEILKMRVTYC